MTIIEKVKKERILKPSNILLALLILFAACDDVRLHTFRELQGEWSATDTLRYDYFNPTKETDFAVEVQLRCAASYPVRELWLRVECTSAGRLSVDTLYCEIYDSLGRQQGSSVGLLRQTSHDAGLHFMQPDDTTRIKVTHLMDGAVKGVADVGVKVCGRGRHLSSRN